MDGRDHRLRRGRACVDPDTFGSIWLGIWWATQTVTTVGYGDVVPEQTAGKVIAVFLMLGGLSFLAVLTGAITSAFVTRAESERQEAGDDPVTKRLDELSDPTPVASGRLSLRLRASGRSAGGG